MHIIALLTQVLILAHVEMIDGTGAPPIADRNIAIENGKIAAITPGADVAPRDGLTVLDLRGYSVMPGIVGMHSHLWSLARPSGFQSMLYSAPRLYLANGVTTIRTAASIETYAELKLKKAIEAGVVPGPHLDVTSPFLEGPGNATLQVPELSGPEDARQTVTYWADRGVTSFKAYQHITRDELEAAIEEAHKHGLKVTGHLCSVTYLEAIDLGIDNLEHGFQVNTELDPDKKPDTCSASRGDYTLEHMTPGGPEANRLIASLVQHHVAITSTLPSLAWAVDPQRPLQQAVLDAMSISARESYLMWRNRPPAAQSKLPLLRRDMDLQRAFVAAGGLLIAGADPVGNANLPGFGDHFEIELLVDAGFTPVQAIRIATLNGATYLGRQDRIGSIAAGKNADLVVIKGDPATHIADIENVEIVFKDGVKYDTRALLDTVKGHYGEY
jgi:imidazolonepropionase-like amidohydrolase